MVTIEQLYMTLINLLKVIILTIFFSGISVADKKNMIGILTTRMPIYDHEVGSFVYLNSIVESFGADSYVIDYHRIYSSYLTGKSGESLESILSKELEKNNIAKIIIPGNYYNIDLDPRAPLPNRQKVTEALLRLSRDRKVKFIAICGGMQGVLHADGIKIISMKKMNIPDHVIKGAKNMMLTQIMVNPASNFAKIIKNDKLEVTNNGWIILNLPDYHVEAISLEKYNLESLNDKGYKIVGFDKNGVVEILEDKSGNFYIQPHPERLVTDQRDAYDSKLVGGSITAMLKLFEHFIKN